MGHPSRKRLRENKKREQKEEMLSRKNDYNVVDLTPHNAIALAHFKKRYFKFK
ncbi:hypothetical protein [Dethiobacter alkaliphilus]|uniref:Uncharacterized protein n=1 Tax=Dethiobacter alkaliphilus AHT 1 TaxID=555088 RepID=C0GGR4_DETAL|nr:hypothetical protein [Dethiobacter alkaliphilus]EEG77505.1 hypothetical protein DealDRAFT_1628 [Dethiobacter alkaliphilus AHT 1]